MSRPYISNQLVVQILSDAGHRCGYCRSDEQISGSLLSIEHILPIARGGTTERANLWRSCRECNEHKGAQIEAIDPESGETVTLYNPRTQLWRDHFRWSEDGLFIQGITAIGRVTVVAMNLNRPHLLVARQRWMLVGWHPPDDT